MLENLYTTKMSADKNKLQHRFSKIRSKNGRLAKSMAFIISIILVVATLCVTIAFAILNKNDNAFKNSLLTINTDLRINDNFNFLILGLDDRNRADTILILSADKEGIKGVSIPRDTAFNTNIADGQVKKITNILAEENGDQKVIDVIRNIFDIPVTYYAKVKLNAIREIIDTVGVIEFDVPMDMEYSDPYQNLKINLNKGKQLLSGAQVCDLLQFRRSNNGQGYANGDLTRIEIGQLFSKEFINQKLNKENMKKLPEICKILADCIDTNYSFSNIKKDVKNLEKIKSTFEIKTIPGELINLDNGIVVYEPDLYNFLNKN